MEKVSIEQTDKDNFLDYYFLKKELVNYCKKHGLSAIGNKEELSQRILYYMETGKTLDPKKKRTRKVVFQTITLKTSIETNIVCSQTHRAFFKKHIGKRFSFNTQFQEWLKNNAGKTYAQAIEAYQQIEKEKKISKTTIPSQFEYNTYIRAFFASNKDKVLSQAIQCWKYKKSQPGSHAYEDSDLEILFSKS